MPNKPNRHEWAVAHFVRAPGYFPSHLERSGIIKLVPGRRPRHKKRRLFWTWKDAVRYAQNKRDLSYFALVYRVGHKPTRLWLWSIKGEDT